MASWLAVSGSLERYSAVLLSRVLTRHGELALRFDRLLSWLLAGCGAQQASMTRSKALKAIGSVVEAEPTLMLRPEVQRAFESCFTDESIAVREAAVDMVGKMITNNAKLALPKMLAKLGFASFFWALIGKGGSNSGGSEPRHGLRSRPLVRGDACRRERPLLDRADRAAGTRQEAGAASPSWRASLPAAQSVQRTGRNELLPKNADESRR